MKCFFKSILFVFLVTAATFTSCKKDVLTTDSSAKLRFSTDTLTFDTVFTQIGSVTKRIMVYNPSKQKIKISSISFKENTKSQFRFNIDGVPGPQVKDLEILGEDSAFVFVEVTVNPNDQTNPFVIVDALQFSTNGNLQEVILEAFGQNAYYYTPSRYIEGFPPLSFLSEYEDYMPISVNVTLPKDKPHVIFGFLLVDSLINLTIEAGTQIHFYDQAGLWMYPGSTLKVEGELDNEVVFQGFRKDYFYKDLPGQWDRIILNESANDHEINYAIIKNSFIGIQTEYFLAEQMATNKLKLTNTVITNSEGVGILSRNYNIEAENCLISNAKNQLLVFQGGGTHRFIHTTVANYWKYGNRQVESFFASNSFVLGNVEIVGDLDIYFGNSVVYGTAKEELDADSNQAGNINIVFDHCVLKTELNEDKDVTWFKDCIFNPVNTGGFGDVLFVSPSNDDFKPKSDSPLRDAGSTFIPNLPSKDLLQINRDAKPDIGCYEFN